MNNPTELSKGHIEAAILNLAVRTDTLLQTISRVEFALTQPDIPVTSNVKVLEESINDESHIVDNIECLTEAISDAIGQLNGMLSYIDEALGTKRLY